MITVKVTDSTGQTVTATRELVVTNPDLKIIGMSSPDDLWDARLEQVGPEGITARRIFIGSLNSSGTNQASIIRDAVDNGLMPVVSFKVPSVATALGGGYDSWVSKLADNLEAYGVTATITYHHEPHGNMTPPQFVMLNERYAPLLKRPNVLFGPFLNGWLLDRRVDDFGSYTSPALLADGWDWFGIDTYESGTIDAPGVTKPADRIPKLLDFLASKGVPDKTIVIGEYNGYTPASILEAGKAFLSCEQLWFACMWNSRAGVGYVLEGTRLAAFKATKSDSRVRQ